MPFTNRKNPRTLEYEDRLNETLIRARDWTIEEAKKNGISPYDVKIPIDDFLELIQIRTPCCNSASQRYFRYWANRLNNCIFEIEEGFFKLKRAIANGKIHGITFPEDKAKPKTEVKPK